MAIFPSEAGWEDCPNVPLDVLDPPGRVTGDVGQGGALRLVLTREVISPSGLSPGVLSDLEGSGSGPVREFRPKKPGWWVGTRENEGRIAKAALRISKALQKIIDEKNAEAWAHRNAADAAWREGDYNARDTATAAAEKADKTCRKWNKRKDALEKCCHGMGHAQVLKCTGCHTERVSVPLGCNQRFCPRCLPKLRAENIRKVEQACKVAAQRQAARNEKTHWRMVVLTMASFPDGELAEMRDFFAACLGKLMRTLWWKKRVRACVACFENTRSANGWHLHCNLLVDCYLDRDELGQLWERTTKGRAKGGLQHVSDVGDTRTAVREVVKYVGKDLGGSDLDGVHDNGIASQVDRLAEFIGAMERFRTLRTFGDCYERSEDEEEHEPRTCECGGTFVFDRTIWEPVDKLAARISAQLEQDRERRHREPGPGEVRWREANKISST